VCEPEVVVPTIFVASDTTGTSVEEVAREILVLGRYEVAPPQRVP
jgi:hypothetical protein